MPGTRDYLRTLIGALGISTAPILFELSQAHPTPAAIWRFAYALPLLALLCLLRRSSRQAFHERSWAPLAMLSGVFFAVDMALWHHSITLVGAGTATLLANTQVIWVALIGFALLGERPSRIFWSSLPVMMAGLFLLAGGSLESAPGETDRLGLLLGVGSGIAYAGMLVLLRRAQLRARVEPQAALLVQVSVALAALSGLGLFEGSIPVSLSNEQHLWLLCLGLGVQALSWILITGGIRNLPGHHGAMILLAQPVSSFVLGWWILDQALDSGRIAGASLVLFGVALPLLRETRRAPLPRRAA